MDVRRTRCRIVGHRHDRVGHQLSRPVVGDVPAAIGALQDGADRRRIDQHVALVGVHAQRVGVRVLQHQQVVVGRFRGQGVLQRVGLVIGNRPERPEWRSTDVGPSSAAQSRVPSRSATLRRNSETFTIDGTVVPAHAEDARRVDGDGLGPVVLGHDHRPACDPIGGQNRHLGLVDDRDGEVGTERTVVRDGERPSGNVIGVELATARRSARSRFRRATPAA